MRNFIQSEIGYRASVYSFGSYIECEDAIIINKIEYEYATNKFFEIPFISASLNYTAVLNTVKFSNQQLSQSMKKEAGLSLVINLVDSDNGFCTMVRAILYGNNPGNTDFKFRITDNDTHSITMKLETAILPTDKQSAQLLQLTFRK